MKALKFGLLTLAAGAAALFGYNRYTTRREWERGSLPGDDIVRDPHIQATHDIIIDAPPDRVWPWLVQVGYDRAGWYIDAPWWRAVIAPVMTKDGRSVLSRMTETLDKRFEYAKK